MSLVCLGDEAAAGRVATMAGWATRMIFDTSDRSEGTIDRDRRCKEQIE